MWVRIHHYTFKQSTMMDLYNSYEKAMKVIDSCENDIQMKGAITYCHLFKDQFIRLGGDETLINVYHSNLIKHINYKINESYRYFN